MKAEARQKEDKKFILKIIIFMNIATRLNSFSPSFLTSSHSSSFLLSLDDILLYYTAVGQVRARELMDGNSLLYCCLGKLFYKTGEFKIKKF